MNRECLFYNYFSILILVPSNKTLTKLFIETALRKKQMCHSRLFSRNCPVSCFWFFRRSNFKLVFLDLVDETTGEEEETVVFGSRGKLYIWKDEQWKERGLGGVKILSKNGASRIVMRRDQVMKVDKDNYWDFLIFQRSVWICQ